MKTLRPYQQAAVDSLFDWFATGKIGNPLLVCPVGSGKTLIIAEIIKRILDDAPRCRIVMLTSTRELLEQNGDELKVHVPHIDMGFYCSALGQKRLHNDVTLASIQSIHNKLMQFKRAPQVIIVDEAHTISHNEQTTYRKFIDAARVLNPNLVVIGLTGTPFRSDSGRLDEGEGRLFDGVAYEIDIGWMIEQGYLCKPVTPKTTFSYDTTGVAKRKGEFVESQLQAAIDKDDFTSQAVQEVIAHGATRKKWLVFTAGIEHCDHVTKCFQAYGIAAEAITGKTSTDERTAILERYKSGVTKCLVNVATMTTGVNIPAIDLVVFMRPTRSPVLYIQMLGRGLRPMYCYGGGYDLETQNGRLQAIASSGKADCMLLDFGGVVDALGAIDALDIRKQYKAKKEDAEKGEAIMKRCPSCGTQCFAAQRYCYECSYNFVNEKLEKAATNTAIVTSDAEPETYSIITLTAAEHSKRGDPNAPTTMRVQYITMADNFSEFVCFNHPIGSYAHDRARAWHKQRLPDVPMPESVAAALKLHYPCPEKITVKREGKYWKVLSVDFNK